MKIVERVRFLANAFGGAGHAELIEAADTIEALVKAGADAFSALVYIFECSDDDIASKAAKEAADKLETALARIRGNPHDR